ncbi:MAG: MOSC N-terminal beta barrel domain-containing protein [Bacteroidetes bacterium]|nr:MOSC N-terminal beta barrel domain-containing protein [Bacteroidota bacterium]
MSQYKITGIYIYPIKSLGGISLQSSAVEERGLQYDRRWMLVDEVNHFITQRSFPQMAL